MQWTSCKKLGDEGRILVRKRVRTSYPIMVEAKSDELCNEYVSEVYEVIKQQGYIVSEW